MVGFADLVAVLLVETLGSIVAVHTGQEERLVSLQASASLTEDEFAQTGIGVGLLDATAAQLFPDDAGGTTLLAGVPIPGKEALEEFEVSLRRGGTSGEGPAQAGALRVCEGLALYLARRQLAMLSEAGLRAVPRVLVEGGTLRAKLNFTAVDIAPAEPSETEAEPTVKKPRDRRVVPDVTDRRLRGITDTRLRRSLLAWDIPRYGRMAPVLHPGRSCWVRISCPIDQYSSISCVLIVRCVWTRASRIRVFRVSSVDT